VVGDPGDELGDSVVVTMPTRYGPARVPSHRVSCTRCHQSTWLSNRAPMDARPLCVVCAMAIVKPDDVITVAPWVADDLAARRELGEPDPMDDL
jgi:hypothetical protein